MLTDVTVTRNKAMKGGGGIFSEASLDGARLFVTFNESFGPEGVPCESQGPDGCDNADDEPPEGDGGGVDNGGKFEASDSVFDHNIAHTRWRRWPAQRRQRLRAFQLDHQQQQWHTTARGSTTPSSSSC